MTTMAWIYLAWSFVVFIGILTLRERAHDVERKAWTEERRELLNRIQAPSYLPVAPRPDLAIPDREPDGWAEVGTITHDPTYGLDD